MSDQLLRQWEILKRIPRDASITVRELVNQLNNLGIDVNRRTVERDLNRLSRAFCLLCDTERKPHQWYYDPQMKPLSIPRLSENEVLSLLLLETYLKPLLPIAVADNLSAQFTAARSYFEQEHFDQKLSEWFKKVKVVAPGQPLLAPPIDSSIQRIVYDALLKGLQLEMDYRTASSTKASHYSSVHIQGLVQYGSVIYLVVTINEHQDLRLLVLHRIQQVSLKDEPLKPFPDFDLDRYIEQGGLGFGRQSQTISLTVLFSNGAGQHLLETPLSVDQQSEQLDAQRVKITATVEETAKLMWWLTGFGPDVEVLSPLSLRNALIERHQLACQQYASS